MGVPEQTCCGKGGTWANGGGPLCAGCRLCPESPTYWKLPQNRGDGQLYRDATLDEAYASADQPKR